jgi:hypothetical protein
VWAGRGTRGSAGGGCWLQGDRAGSVNQCVVKRDAVWLHQRRGIAAVFDVIAVPVARAAPAVGGLAVAVDQTAIDRIGEIELADVEAERGVEKVGLMGIGPGSADVGSADAAAVVAAADSAAAVAVVAAPGDRPCRRRAMNQSRCLPGELSSSRVLLGSARLSANHRRDCGALRNLRQSDEASYQHRGAPVQPSRRLATGAGSVAPGGCLAQEGCSVSWTVYAQGRQCCHTNWPPGGRGGDPGWAKARPGWAGAGAGGDCRSWTCSRRFP